MTIEERIQRILDRIDEIAENEEDMIQALEILEVTNE